MRNYGVTTFLLVLAVWRNGLCLKPSHKAFSLSKKLHSPDNSYEHNETSTAEEATEPSDKPIREDNDKGVVMNFYDGDDSAEAKKEAAPSKEVSDGIEKISDVISRLEEDTEGETAQESTLDTEEADREEAHASAKASDIVGDIKKNAEKEDAEAEKAKNLMEQESERHESEVKALNMEKDVENEKEQSEEQHIRNEMHDTELDMEKKEEMIKEDEDEIKAEEMETQENLKKVKEDENEKMDRVEEVAQLRKKELEKENITPSPPKKDADKPSPEKSLCGGDQECPDVNCLGDTEADYSQLAGDEVTKSPPSFLLHGSTKRGSIVKKYKAPTSGKTNRYIFWL